MTDLLLQSAVSNVCISLALAFAAIVVEMTTKRPAIAHLLWVLVLVKLVTPPIVTIPVIAMPGPSDRAATSELPGVAAPTTSIGADIEADVSEVPPAEQMKPAPWEQIKPVILLVWLAGSGFILIWSLMRVYRFDHLLRKGTEAAPLDLRARAARIAERLGLKSVPMVCITTAQLSPLVWWVGGKIRIVIPQSLLDQMDAEHVQWVLAHELAHVRRRDYLVRWLEWLACVGFWWNPLVWWGRQHLRANEEVCCDDLVLSSLNPKPRTYAESLLNAIEHLASPVLRPPAIASEINSGGFLRRRFKMIVSGKTDRSRSRWPQVCVLLGAMLVLPLGLAYGEDLDAKTNAYLKRAWSKLQAEVEAGNMSTEDAEARMAGIKKAKLGDGKNAGAALEVYLEKTWAKLQAAVKAGKLTEAQAKEKMAAIKKAKLSDEKMLKGN
jgi:beta-lactamase regulating signal transducer with metallopeptidase domain